jgi:hypothetical protein
LDFSGDVLKCAHQNFDFVAFAERTGVGQFQELDNGLVLRIQTASDHP